MEETESTCFGGTKGFQCTPCEQGAVGTRTGTSIVLMLPGDGEGPAAASSELQGGGVA